MARRQPSGSRARRASRTRVVKTESSTPVAQPAPAAAPVSSPERAAAPVVVVVVESLEHRQLLASVSLSDGVLIVRGDASSSNALVVTPSGTSSLVVRANNISKTYSRSAVDRIKVYGGSRGDLMAVSPSLTIPTTLDGNEGNDSIYGGGGRDLVWANEGSDLAYGNGGNDTVYGQSGNDTIYGGPGTDKVYGEGGTDKVTSLGPVVAGPGSGGSTSGLVPAAPTVGPSTSTSTSTSSAITLSNGVLTLRGSRTAANTIRVAMSGTSTLVATVNGASRSFASSAVSRLSIAGGDNNDVIAVAPTVTEPAFIRAGAGNDKVYGGAKNDTVYAGAGDDLVYGNGANDKLSGEAGRDSLHGGTGSDWINGGDGTDWVEYGGSSSAAPAGTGTASPTGPAPIYSTPEPSTSSTSTTAITLSSGVLTLKGALGTANTMTVALSGSSTLVATVNRLARSFSTSSVSKLSIAGGDANDVIAIAPAVTEPAYISAGKGNDKVYAGAGRDTIYGGGGSDTVYANGGNDNASGGDANDTLYGGPGDDTVEGNAGTDKIDYGGTAVAGPVGGSTSSGSSTGGSPPLVVVVHNDDDVITDIPSSTPAPVPVITATTNRTFQAGHAFHAHALASSLKVGNPNTARFHWDFGDAGSKYNTLDGFNVAHVYDHPGTYTVRLTVTNAGGRTTSTTTTLTVQPSTRRKIYVSTTGSDSNDGRSPSSPIRTVAKAASMLRSDIELLFRRGDSFNTYGQMTLAGHNVVVGAYGTGARPVLLYRGPLNYTAIIATHKDGHDFTIQDLTFDSEYDTWTNDQGNPRAVTPIGRNTTIRDSQFLNLGYAINTSSKPTGVLAMDNVAPDPASLYGYFAWVQGTDHVYLGNSVANVKGHVIRVGGSARINITGNDLSNPVEGGVIRGTLTLQGGEYVYVARNKLNFAKATVGPLESTETIDQRSRWVVLEGNEFNSLLILRSGSEELMLRNNLHRRDGSYAIEIEGYDYDLDRGVKNVTIVNNTVVNMDENGNFMSVRDGARGITLANNLFLAPNLVTGSYATGAVRVFDNLSSLRSFAHIGNNVWGDPEKKTQAHGGVAFVAPEFPYSGGYRTPTQWNALAQVATDYFVDTKYGSGYAPSTDSYAANAAARFGGVFTDKNGKLRPTSGAWTAGAIEV